MEKEIWANIFKVFKKHFFSVSGLLIGILIIIYIEWKFLDNEIVKYFEDFKIRIIIYCVVIIVWFIFWIIKRELFPKNKKRKIGILIAILSENDKQKIRIQNDFLKELKHMIYTNNLSEKIHMAGSREKCNSLA